MLNLPLDLAFLLNLPLDLACVRSISRSISRVCSFGGGTDVAGPLRRALDVLETPVAEEVIASD